MTRPIFHAALGLLFAALVGCGGTPAPMPPNMTPGGPAVEVVQPDDGPVRLFWSPPRALRVEIRHAGTGALAWRASAGATRLGPLADVLPAPLVVAPVGPPRGGPPPDGRGAEASTPTLERGEPYVVTVVPCRPSGEGTPSPTCTETAELSYPFTARRTSAPSR